MEYILSICLIITLSFDDKSSPDKSRTPPLVPISGVFAICVSQLSSCETPMFVPHIVSPEKLPIPTLVPSSGIATILE